MAKMWREALWEPFKEYSGPPVEVDDVTPRRRDFMELDSNSIGIPDDSGLQPRSRAMRKLIEDRDER